MHATLRTSAMIMLLGTSLASHADPRASGSVAGVADDSQSRSLDADAIVSGGTWWVLGGGGGVTRSPSAIGMLDGTAERALAGVRANDFDLRAYYRHWNANPFDNQTAGARPSWTHSGLTVSGIAEWRSFAVSYADSSVGDAQSVAHLSGHGFGGGLKYACSPWSVGVDAVWYTFHSLSQYVAQQNAIPATPGSSITPGSPALLPILTGPVSHALPTLPTSLLGVAPSLTNSVVTLNQSALQHLINADLARDFGRASVHLDWINARDAVLQTTVNSYSGSYRQQFNDRWSGTLTLGTNDSAYGNSVFGGFAVGFVL